MSRAFPRDWKKWDTNSVPRLDVTWAGTPCLENMWSRKSFASSGLVMVLWVGMKMDCLDNTNIQHVGEDGVDKSLERCGSISETEGHYQPFIRPIAAAIQTRWYACQRSTLE